jgi:hypothetical protein
VSRAKTPWVALTLAVASTALAGCGGVKADVFPRYLRSESGDQFVIGQVGNADGGLPGLTAIYHGDRFIVLDTVARYPDSAHAKEALQQAVAIPIRGNPTAQNVEIGDGGTFLLAPSVAQSKSGGMLLFTKGAALAILQFQGTPTDPVTAPWASSIAQDQNSNIPDW